MYLLLKFWLIHISPSVSSKNRIGMQFIVPAGIVEMTITITILYLLTVKLIDLLDAVSNSG